MRYWHPTAEETLRRLAAEGIERAVVLSMYPHYTGATTGSSINDFRRAAARVCPDLSYSVIEQWYDWPGYLDALANRVREGLGLFHELVQDQVQILSAHALPQKFIDAATLLERPGHCQGVMQRLGERPEPRLPEPQRTVKWMEPDTVG
jgi:ferrochelatase